MESLIKLESYSYLVEFCGKFKYTGSFETIRDATTAPSLDSINNYETLECIGDTVLKLIASLYYYLKDPNIGEGVLTAKRTASINNKFLSKIAMTNGLDRYLKCEGLTLSRFQPPFHEGKCKGHKAQLVDHLMSEAMLADFVEALMGAFYHDEGIYQCAIFMERLGVFSRDAT